MKILITGGLGYIGSVAAEILSQKHSIVVLDDLRTGNADALDDFDVTVGHSSNLDSLQFKCDEVEHLAASALVGESMQYPSKYFENNVVFTKWVLDWCVERRVKKIVFASSSAVYGHGAVSVSED